MTTQVVADTSLLIGLLNSQDVWSQKARALLTALDRNQAEAIYFDCVIAEAISTRLQRLYAGVLDLIESSSGELNFNDALIALACREYQIEWIASFDADFDQVGWLRRVASAQDILPD